MTRLVQHVETFKVNPTTPYGVQVVSLSSKYVNTVSVKPHTKRDDENIEVLSVVGNGTVVVQLKRDTKRFTLRYDGVPNPEPKESVMRRGSFHVVNGGKK